MYRLARSLSKTQLYSKGRGCQKKFFYSTMDCNTLMHSIVTLIYSMIFNQGSETKFSSTILGGDHVEQVISTKNKTHILLNNNFMGNQLLF